MESLHRQMRTLERDMERKSARFAKIMQEYHKVIESVAVLSEAHAQVVDIIVQKESIPSYFDGRRI